MARRSCAYIGFRVLAHTAMTCVSIPITGLLAVGGAIYGVIEGYGGLEWDAGVGAGAGAVVGVATAAYLNVKKAPKLADRWHNLWLQRNGEPGEADPINRNGEAEEVGRDNNAAANQV